MPPRILLALMLAWGPMTQWGPANQPAQWDGDHDRAMAAARREHRAAVLYFTLPFDATSHEVFIRLKTEPRLVDAMDRMVRIVVEQPDLGIAYGRYRLAEFPALAVLDPGGALVDTVTITPHSEAWVHAFLATLAEAHARTAAWVHPHPPPPRVPPCPPRCEPPAVVEVPQFCGPKARAAAPKPAAPKPAAPKPGAPVDARTAIRAKLALCRAKRAALAKPEVQPPAKPSPAAMLAPIRK